MELAIANVRWYHRIPGIGILIWDLIKSVASRSNIAKTGIEIDNSSGNEYVLGFPRHNKKRVKALSKVGFGARLE